MNIYNYSIFLFFNQKMGVDQKHMKPFYFFFIHFIQTLAIEILFYFLLWTFQFFKCSKIVMMESCNSNHWKSSENFSMINIRQNNDLMYVHFLKYLQLLLLSCPSVFAAPTIVVLIVLWCFLIYLQEKWKKNLQKINAVHKNKLLTKSQIWFKGF